MPEIIVLMSTYNGAKYLDEQIQSIINQSINNMILVRDDGSTDGTQLILEKYQKESNLQWYQGENIGFAKSFLTLLKNAPNAAYYAFADQDDYWEKNKLEIAIKKIEEKKIPCLYCSNLIIVDENLNELPVLYNQGNISTQFENILWRNISAGCTMVFNNSLGFYIKSYDPQGIKYHDWWVCLLAAALGTIVYDPNAYIKYRQHSMNVVGCNNGTSRNLKWIKEKIVGKEENIRWNFGRSYHRELLLGYKENLNDDQKQVLKDLLQFNNNYIARIRLVFNKKILFGNFKSIFYKKILIVLGKN